MKYMSAIVQVCVFKASPCRLAAAKRGVWHLANERQDGRLERVPGTARGHLALDPRHIKSCALRQQAETSTIE